MELKPIKELDMGAGTLVEVEYIQQVFGVSRRTAMCYLKALRIKPFYFKNDVYFSLPTMKRILFVLSKPGSPGFVFPGSRAKKSAAISGNPNFLFKVTDDILAEAAQPEIAAEMLSCDGRHPDIVKKLISRPVGRPRSKKENGE